MALAAAKISVKSRFVAREEVAYQWLRDSRRRRSANGRMSDIRARVTELEEERFRLRFRSATEALEEAIALRWLRRDIARLKTVLRERERGVHDAPW